MNNRSVIEKRRLGSAEVSAIGLGCMSLSNVYGASDDDAGVDLIHEALDRGVVPAHDEHQRAIPRADF